MQSTRKVKQVLALMAAAVGVYAVLTILGDARPSVTVDGVGRRPADPPSVEPHLLLARQVDRRHLVQRVCALAAADTQSTSTRGTGTTARAPLLGAALDHLIVDDDHRLLYCYVPKVACTNWKRMMMVLSGASSVRDPMQIAADASHRPAALRRLSNFSAPEAAHRLRTYTKFMFVRHPFERLLSAFRNKFHAPPENVDYFPVRFGRHIVRHYRANASAESLARGHDVTFQEFVQYVIDPETTSRAPFNEHWMPAVDLCRPCQIDYDIIGKYETLSDDAWLVLDRINVTESMHFPGVGVKVLKTGSLLDTYLDGLTPSQLLRLYHVYELDFRLFDYHTDRLVEQQQPT